MRASIDRATRVGPEESIEKNRPKIKKPPIIAETIITTSLACPYAIALPNVAADFPIQKGQGTPSILGNLIGNRLYCMNAENGKKDAHTFELFFAVGLIS